LGKIDNSGVSPVPGMEKQRSGVSWYPDGKAVAEFCVINVKIPFASQFGSKKASGVTRIECKNGIPIGKDITVFV